MNKTKTKGLNDLTQKEIHTLDDIINKAKIDKEPLRSVRFTKDRQVIEINRGWLCPKGSNTIHVPHFNFALISIQYIAKVLNCNYILAD